MIRTRYEPTPEDLVFFYRLIDMLADSGLWGASFGIYQIDKKARTFTLTMSLGDEDAQWKARCCLEEIGWRVK